MFSLTKQQVKSLLEVMGNDDARPMLQQLKIDLFNDKPVLVTTDSYQMAIFALSDNVLPEMGKMIDRKEIVKWYKLASAKDLFTEVDLIDAPATEDGNYPKWQTLIPKREDMTDIPSLGLNATYLLNLGKLAGNTGMILEFYGRRAPIVSRTGDNIFVLMPLKS
jgi:DNA polymerase III sliding clamp (beta) subunit (PCNA family)